jgi:hypothetical protein
MLKLFLSGEKPRPESRKQLIAWPVDVDVFTHSVKVGSINGMCIVM